MGTDTGNGKVVQVIGPVVDIEFPPGKLPYIFNALTITQETGIRRFGAHAVRLSARQVMSSFCPASPTKASSAVSTRAVKS